MATDRHIYGEVNSKTGMKNVFLDIRKDVEQAKSRPAGRSANVVVRKRAVTMLFA